MCLPQNIFIFKVTVLYLVSRAKHHYLWVFVSEPVPRLGNGLSPLPGTSEPRWCLEMIWEIVFLKIFFKPQCVLPSF